MEGHRHVTVEHRPTTHTHPRAMGLLMFITTSTTPVILLNTFRTGELDYSKIFMVPSLSSDFALLRFSLQCPHGKKQARKKPQKPSQNAVAGQDK